MADTVEMQDIRGLDIDKAVKGFALGNYIFKNDCTISSMSGDSIRWYQETAADLTATTPQQIANISPLSAFTNLEPSWTRNTSYIRKYAAEGFISMEDMKSADVDVVARTLLRLTRAVVKQVDARIYDIITESRVPVNIQSFHAPTYASAAWNAPSASGADIVKCLAHAKKLIADNDYNPEGAVLYLDGQDYESMLVWLISNKGSSIPNFSSDKITNGTVMSLMGLNIKVSTNVSGGAVVVVPQRACTWKTYQDTTSRAIEDPGKGTKFRVWELGEAILTDPKAVVLISGTFHTYA